MLTDWLWPGTRIWTTDVDRGITDRQGKVLATASGVAAEAIHHASLAPLAQRIVGSTPPRQSRWPWILTIGARGARRSGGSQLCPACLDGDAVPYYRVQWRLAWHTACAVHACALHERCPECGACVMAHRLSIDATHVALCAGCGADLRRAPVRPAAGPALDLQSATDEIVRDGAGRYLGVAVDAVTWLAVVEFFVRLVRRAVRAPSLGLDALLASAGVDAPPALRASVGAGVERLRVEERRRVLDAVARLMALDAEALEEAVAASGLTRQGWLGGSEPAPGPLAAMTRALGSGPNASTPRAPRRPRAARPRPRHQVLQMMARLERRHRATRE